MFILYIQGMSKHALFVGASNDMQMMLQQAYKYDPANILSISDDQVTDANIRSALLEIVAASSQLIEVWICLYGESLSTLSSELPAMIRSISCRVFLIIDPTNVGMIKMPWQFLYRKDNQFSLIQRSKEIIANPIYVFGVSEITLLTALRILGYRTTLLNLYRQMSLLDNTTVFAASHSNPRYTLTANAVSSGPILPSITSGVVPSPNGSASSGHLFRKKAELMAQEKQNRVYTHAVTMGSATPISFQHGVSTAAPVQQTGPVEFAVVDVSAQTKQEQYVRQRAPGSGHLPGLRAR